MSNFSNVPWYLVLGLALTVGIGLVWTIEMVWNGLTGKGQDDERKRF